MSTPHASTAGPPALHHEAIFEWTRRGAESSIHPKCGFQAEKTAAGPRGNHSKTVQPAAIGTALPAGRVPPACPFSMDQNLDPDFLP